MKPREKERAEYLLNLFWESYSTSIASLAQEVFEREVKPFLKKRGWMFIAGNGTYYMGTDENIWEDLVNLEERDDPELAYILELLELEVEGFQQDLGSLMPDYDERMRHGL